MLSLSESKLSYRPSLQYDDVEYWNKRYGDTPEVFEWYQTYGELRSVLRKHLSLDAAILQVGVGTSTLQADMVTDGFSAIISIDNSSAAIAFLSRLHASCPELVYMVADCTDMPEFDDGAFDAVLDKGTMDAMLCGRNALPAARAMLGEASRVLRPGGLFILVTYGGPDYRLPYLEDPACGWDVLVYVLGRNPGQDEWEPSPEDEPPPPAPAVPPPASPAPAPAQEHAPGATTQRHPSAGPAAKAAEQAVGLMTCNGAAGGGPPGDGECRPGAEAGWRRPASLEWARGPRLRGPWAAFNPAHRQVLSNLSSAEDVHFIYLCKKRGA